LLALLLGFTFSMATERFDARRALVNQESNAISSTFLMGQTFAEPHRSQIDRILMLYTDSRLAAAQQNDPSGAAGPLRESHLLQGQFWRAALAATSTLRDDISSSFLQTGYQMIETANSREAARRAIIPSRIYVMLLAYMIITAAVLGFTQVSARATMPLLFLITLAVILTIDIDRPTSGGVRESQRSMELLQAHLHAFVSTDARQQSRATDAVDRRAPETQH
jgi:hypothetical protein